MSKVYLNLNVSDRVNSIKPPHWWPNLRKTTTFGLRDKKPPHLSWFFAEHPNDEFAAN
jgi:hypothetical protein